MRASAAKKLNRAPLRPLAEVRDLPAYTYPEASRALNIPTTTLGTWTRGQVFTDKRKKNYFEPLIRRPVDDTRLSYNNLIEAHVLRALRTIHDVSVEAVRDALHLAGDQFGIKRLLIHEDFRYDAGDLFIRRYGQLVTLSPGQQLAIEKVLEMYLYRVEYDSDRLPFRFYPLTQGDRAENSPKLIVLSPFLSFGRPVVERIGVSTRAIFSRIDAGESPNHVREDYGLTREELEEAILYEAPSAA